MMEQSFRHRFQFRRVPTKAIADAAAAAEDIQPLPPPPPSPISSSSSNDGFNIATKSERGRRPIFYFSDSEEEEEDEVNFSKDEEEEADFVILHSPKSRRLELLRGHFTRWTDGLQGGPIKSSKDMVALADLQKAIDRSLVLIEAEKLAENQKVQKNQDNLEQELLRLITGALPSSLLEDYLKVTCFMETGPTSSPKKGSNMVALDAIPQLISSINSVCELKGLVLFLRHYLLKG